MEKKLKQWIFAFFAIVITISFSSCSEDEPNYDSVDDIAGVYVGQLNMIGFSDEEAEVAYVNLSKKSSSAVSCTIESEGWNVNMTPVNLVVTFNENVITLKSEAGKLITGQIIKGNLQLTYETRGGNVFQFLGTKD